MNVKSGIMLLLVASLFFSCKTAVEKTTAIRPIKVAEVTSFSFTTNTFSGIVTPDQFSNLAFRTSGPLISVAVEEGQNVKKGQVIAKMDPLNYQLDFDAKKASYITAKLQLDRAEKLLSRQAISQQEYETIIASTENAKASYENAKQMLEETILRAPFDGFIQQKFAENYQEVRQGEKVVCLINPSKLQMTATLPENALSFIQNNPEMYVEFDAYKGVKFKAKIKEYVQASPDGSGIPIFVYIDDPNFNLTKYRVAVGFSCAIEIVIRDNNFNAYTVIPFTSLINNPDNNTGCVYVYNPSTKRVNKREVKYGEIFNKDKVVIASGLTPGELVVSAGATRVIDGEEVKLLND